MKLFKSTIVVLAAVLGVLVQSANPAGALTIAGGVAVVTLTTTAPLGYPVLNQDGPVGSGFTVTSTVACAAVEVSLKKAVPVGAGACTLTGVGTFGAGLLPELGVVGPGPYCGHSVGNVAGNVTANSLTQGVQVYAYAGAFTTAGSVVVIVGTSSKASSGQTGPFVFVGVAVPSTLPGGPTSCLNGTQTQFTAAGIFGTTLL